VKYLSVSQNFSLLENYVGNYPLLNKQDGQTRNKDLKINAVLNKKERYSRVP